MKNIIPYNLFEMSKISDNELRDYMIQFLEYFEDNIESDLSEFLDKSIKFSKKYYEIYDYMGDINSNLVNNNSLYSIGQYDINFDIDVIGITYVMELNKTDKMIYTFYFRDEECRFTMIYQLKAGIKGGAEYFHSTSSIRNKVRYYKDILEIMQNSIKDEYINKK